MRVDEGVVMRVRMDLEVRVGVRLVNGSKQCSEGLIGIGIGIGNG